MSELRAALVDALSELSVVSADRSATIPTKSGSFSYRYADLADVVRISRAVLSKHGIVALTPIESCEDDQLAVSVLLVHRSGETMQLGRVRFAAGGDARATGSAITYHRRYALLAALGLAASGDDDDGEAASAQAPARTVSPGAAAPQSRARDVAPACTVCGASLAGASARKTPTGPAHVHCLEEEF